MPSQIRETIWPWRDGHSVFWRPVARPPQIVKPVFIYSSFRTSSTWLWQAFREDPRAIAYCEVFHEALADMRIDDIPRYRHDVWQSNHPPGAPYFLEFGPLLKADGGVHCYKEEFALSQFIPAEGLTGPLTPDAIEYVSGLVEHARAEKRLPVITCCRSLGRIKALKRAFPGWHIFLCRNLFQQWMSYLSQHQQGNDYFINSVAHTLRLNTHDSFLAELEGRYLKRSSADTSSVGEFGTIDAAFSAFAGLHIYLSIFAAEIADQIIDVNVLARNPDKVIRVEAEIFRRAGLRVKLRDVKESVDCGGVHDTSYVPQQFEKILYEFYQLACEHLSPLIGRRSRAFGKKYVSDAIAEFFAFQRFNVGFQRGFERNLVLMRELLDKLKVSESRQAEVKKNAHSM